MEWGKCGYYLAEIILPSMKESMYILVFTMMIVGIGGFFLGVLLFVSKEQGLYPMKRVHRILNISINILRSVPSIIFIICLMPLARIFLPSALGKKAAIFYLSIMNFGFIARIVNDKLETVDESLIEAAHSMGLSNKDILFKYIVNEAKPTLVRGYTFATVMMLGAIAIAGLVGAGGIGAVAMNYGYRAYNDTIMYLSIFVIFVVTVVIQILGRFLSYKLE